MFSSRSYMASGLMFKFLMQVELIAVSGVRQGSNFIVLHVLSFVFMVYIAVVHSSNLRNLYLCISMI